MNKTYGFEQECALSYTQNPMQKKLQLGKAEEGSAALIKLLKGLILPLPCV